MSLPFSKENVWLKKHKYQELERIYYESLAKGIQPVPGVLSVSHKDGQKELSELLSEDKVAGVHKRKYNEVDKDPNEVEEKVKLIHPLGDEKWQKEKPTKYSTIEKSPGKRDSPSRLKSEKLKMSRNRRKSKGHSLSESSNPEEKISFAAPKSLPVEVVTQTETEKQLSVETQTPPPTLLSQPIIQPVQEKETKKKKKNRWRNNPAKMLLRNSNEEKPVQGNTPNNSYKSSFASEVAKARQHIKSSLECIDGIEDMASKKIGVDLTNRINQLEKEKNDLKQQLVSLQDVVKKLESRLSKLELGSPAKSAPAKPPPKAKQDDDDDGVDLFGSDSEEDEEAVKLKEARLAAYAAKKSKKPALIAKSSIVLDVKPWDDETDMKMMEQEVRKIATEGLLWGASKLVPLAYGIHKLQISCVVEDDKVSVDWLQETIEEIENYVQSVDIAAFNKI